MRILKTIILIVISLVFFGCASKNYNSAMKQDTVFAYNDFLQEYGDSEYANKARYTRNALIAFNKAKQTDTVDGYDKFLLEYSSSRYEYPAKNKKDLLLQKSDYDKAIQNENTVPNMIISNTTLSLIPSLLKRIMFQIYIEDVDNIMIYDKFLEKWKYKGNSALNDDIRYQKKQKAINIKNKYISDLKNNLKNSESAIKQAHIMGKFAYKKKYWDDMQSDKFLQKFYRNMQNCFILEKDIIVVEEDYTSIGGSLLSLDTTTIYAGKIFKGDVVYTNGQYARTLHNVRSLTSFTTNHNDWLEKLKGKEAFGSYSEFKQEHKLSNEDLFSNNFLFKMIEKFVPTKYSTTTSSFGGGIGNFISDNPLTSLAIGAVTYKALK